MKLDAMTAVEPARAGPLAAELEAAGYDGFWTTETQHDPYLPIAAAAATTSRIELGTAIATAFTRSPMVTAMAAWDLQRASGGRFLVAPSVYVLRASTARDTRLPDSIGHLRFDEFHAPPLDTVPLSVQSLAAPQYLTGRDADSIFVGRLVVPVAPVQLHR